MTSIAIRADGGTKIGMGHVMRTLVLAKELAKTNNVFYVCRVDNPLSNKYKYGINKIKEEGFKVVYVDENNLIIELSKIHADCLITDSYDVDQSYFIDTKKLFEKTGYFDDMNLYYFDVDFIINQNINAEDLKYKIDRRTKLFLGLSFVVLRNEFRKTKTKDVNKDVNNILITLGGSDFYNYTGKIIEFIKEMNYIFHIVVGPSFSHVESLRYYQRNNDNIKLYFDVDMIKLMLMSDMAIASCGSTLYELAACGIPTIGVVVAENQSKIAKKMEEKKIIINLGNIESVKKENLVNTIEKLSYDLDVRKELNTNQSIAVNKNGVKKLCASIQENILS